MKLVRKKKQEAARSEKSDRSHREKLAWTAKGLGVLFVVIALLGALYHIHSRQVTKQRFADTASRISIAESTVKKDYQAQAAALEIAYNLKDIAKTCYMNQPIGGGPDAGGPELWCGVSVTKTISVPPSTEAIDALLDKLNIVAKSEGLAVDPAVNDVSAGYVRTPNYNTGQLIGYSAGNGDAYNPGGYGCSVDAQSDYLPYDNQGDYVLRFSDQASQGYAPGTKQASLRYELKCDGAAAYTPKGYAFLADL